MRQASPTGPRIVAVTTRRCAQCRAMMPDLESVIATFRDRIPIDVIDAELEPELVADLGIRATPTLVLYDVSGGVRLLTGRRSHDELTHLAESLTSIDGTRGPGRKEKTDFALRLAAGAILAGTGMALPAVMLSATGAVVVVWAVGGYLRAWMKASGHRSPGAVVNGGSEPSGRARPGTTR